MSAIARHRFASRLVRCLAAAGLMGAAACTGGAVSSPPPGPAGAEQRIERDLERLDALEVLELGEVATTRTEHQWVPYGGFWTSSEVDLGVEEQADRLDSLAEVAERAVAGIDGADIPSGFEDETGAPNLCVRLDDEHFCLTREMHADNLRRINDLEIVDVVDIIRSEPAMSGFCYSSWDTVREQDCVRALELDALVAATADFPSAEPPEGEPE